jgi:hypothetical protein
MRSILMAWISLKDRREGRNPSPILMSQNGALHPEPAKPPILATQQHGKLLPRGIPRVARLAITLTLVVFSVVLFLFGGAFGGSRFARRKEVTALNALCSLNLPEQLSQAQKLCTTQGFAIARELIVKDGYFVPASFKVTGIKTNPRFCDLEMVRESAEGKSRIAVRLLDQSGWKFHDVFIYQANGKPINLWCSYAIENPTLSALEVNWDDIKRTAKDFLEFCQLLKQLSEDCRDRKVVERPDPAF